MSLNQAHILLKNGVAELTLSLNNELSELIIVFLKIKQIFEIYIIVLYILYYIYNIILLIYRYYFIIYMQTVSFNLFMNALEKNIIAFDMLAYSDNTLNSFIDMGTL